MLSKTAIIETNITGKNVSIGHFAVISDGVVIGDNVTIHPHVVIEAGVRIGNNVEIFPGAYLGKRPKGAGAVSREIDYQLQINIGDNCIIGPNAVIYYDVSIGNNTLICENASIREKVIIGEFCLISRSVTINYNTMIGNHTKIMDMTHITGNCQIGNNVFISVLVSTTNDRAIGKLGYDEDRVQGSKIGDGVGIGAGANIDVLTVAKEKYNFDLPAFYRLMTNIDKSIDIKSQPLVSVIIPCYNHANFLSEAIESVVNQTYKNWECIIVNDGSPDNTSEVAKFLIEQYENHQISLKEKTNGGVTDTRTAGIKQSSGQYRLCL